MKGKLYYITNDKVFEINSDNSSVCINGSNWRAKVLLPEHDESGKTHEKGVNTQLSAGPRLQLQRESAVLYHEKMMQEWHGELLQEIEDSERVQREINIQIQVAKDQVVDAKERFEQLSKNESDTLSLNSETLDANDELSKWQDELKRRRLELRVNEDYCAKLQRKVEKGDLFKCKKETFQMTIVLRPGVAHYFGTKEKEEKKRKGGSVPDASQMGNCTLLWCPADTHEQRGEIQVYLKDSDTRTFRHMPLKSDFLIRPFRYQLSNVFGGDDTVQSKVDGVKVIFPMVGGRILSFNAVECTFFVSNRWQSTPVDASDLGLKGMAEKDMNLQLPLRVTYCMQSQRLAILLKENRILIGRLERVNRVHCISKEDADKAMIDVSKAVSQAPTYRIIKLGIANTGFVWDMAFTPVSNPKTNAKHFNMVISMPVDQSMYSRVKMQTVTEIINCLYSDRESNGKETDNDTSAVAISSHSDFDKIFITSFNETIYQYGDSHVIVRWGAGAKDLSFASNRECTILYDSHQSATVWFKQVPSYSICIAAHKLGTIKRMVIHCSGIVFVQFTAGLGREHELFLYDMKRRTTDDKKLYPLSQMPLRSLPKRPVFSDAMDRDFGVGDQGDLHWKSPTPLSFSFPVSANQWENRSDACNRLHVLMSDGSVDVYNVFEYVQRSVKARGKPLAPNPDVPLFGFNHRYVYMNGGAESFIEGLVCHDGFTEPLANQATAQCLLLPRNIGGSGDLLSYMDNGGGGEWKSNPRRCPVYFFEIDPANSVSTLTCFRWCAYDFRCKVYYIKSGETNVENIVDAFNLGIGHFLICPHLGFVFRVAERKMLQRV